MRLNELKPSARIMAGNGTALEDKKLKGTALGLWYQQIPNGYVVNPLGEVVEPKEHNSIKTD